MPRIDLAPAAHPDPRRHAMTATQRTAALLVLATCLAAPAQAQNQTPAAASAPVKPALSVSVVSPALASLPVQLQANGNFLRPLPFEF